MMESNDLAAAIVSMGAELSACEIDEEGSTV